MFIQQQQKFGHTKWVSLLLFPRSDSFPVVLLERRDSSIFIRFRLCIRNHHFLQRRMEQFTPQRCVLLHLIRMTFRGFSSLWWKERFWSIMWSQLRFCSICIYSNDEGHSNQRLFQLNTCCVSLINWVNFLRINTVKGNKSNRVPPSVL